MRMGSGNSQALGRCSGKRGRAPYPGLQGSKQKLSPKTGFLLLGSVIPVFSLSLASSWANLGIRLPFCLLHVCHRNPGILSCLLLFLCPNINQRAQRYSPSTPVSGLSSSLLEQDKTKRFGGSTTSQGNDAAGCWQNSLPGIQR